MSKHLLVIDPVVNDVETQGAEEVMLGWGGTVRHLRPGVRGEDRIGPGDGYEGIDGVVVMGSAASVYDPHAWLDGVKAWLTPLLEGERQLPVLGICFGHQLIASLQGGRVGYLHEDQRKRVGFEESRVEGSRLLGDTSLRVLVSHRQVVVEPPEGYRTVATRPGVSYDGFDHASLPIHTFQFHPEARDLFAERVGIPPEGVDARLIEDGRRLMRSFHALVLRDAG